jgi:UPF0755 protein
VSPPEKRRRAARAWALWFVLPVVAGAAVLCLFLVQVYVPVGREGPPVEVRVTRGMSLRQVADELSARGLIRSTRAFRVAGRLGGMAAHVQAGRYRFSRQESAADILRALREGRMELVRLTVPEGLTARQTAALVELEAGLPAEEFLAYVDTLDASRVLGFSVPGMEGFLFPETYFLGEGASAEEVVRLMVKAFHRAVGDSFPERASRVGLTPLEAVTLASVIERETSVPGERAWVSAVYHNRLRRGWRLEADPTVRFALDRWDGPLTYADLDVDSPYNTYRRVGLPPGPIASPGKASLDAAVGPAPGVEDMFFVARGDGSHEFSRTLDAHLRAMAAARRNSPGGAGPGGRTSAS